MSGSSIFTLTPTFTQGLLFGQLSILVLLSLILKYLFLDSGPAPPYSASAYSTATFEKERITEQTKGVFEDAAEPNRVVNDSESAVWFNLLLHQVIQTYRSKLRDDLPGAEGDEIARQRVERFANSIRPESFVDPIHILSVDLGRAAPHLSNARVSTSEPGSSDCLSKIEFDMAYTDTVSVSLSTSVLFHYPIPYFVRLPITLTVTLSLFSSSITLLPPDPRSSNPTLTVSLPPDFTLDLKTTSLMGSRAKLADVPKLHEMIQSQVRRAIAEKGTWKVVMPWVASVEEVKKEELTLE